MPERLTRIRLVIEEWESERTQEFVLTWSPGEGHSYRKIVRQQYVFSPSTTPREVEDYTMDLHGVTTLELRIQPASAGAMPSRRLPSGPSP